MGGGVGGFGRGGGGLGLSTQKVSVPERNFPFQWGGGGVGWSPAPPPPPPSPVANQGSVEHFKYGACLRQCAHASLLLLLPNSAKPQPQTQSDAQYAAPVVFVIVAVAVVIVPSSSIHRRRLVVAIAGAVLVVNAAVVAVVVVVVRVVVVVESCVGSVHSVCASVLSPEARAHGQSHEGACVLVARGRLAASDHHVRRDQRTRSLHVACSY